MTPKLPIWAKRLDESHRYKSMRSGRGAGKSWAVAMMLLAVGGRQKHRILCTREFQNSIRDSVHKLLADQIYAMGLGDFYEVGQNKIVGNNGTEFLFAGLRHHIQSIKSTEGITIVWVEEAQAVSEESWAVLIPTIRTPGSEIWLTWNPDSEDDATWRRFVEEPPPDCLDLQLNHTDNPFFPDVLKQEMDYLYRVDPEAAAHVWGGNPRKNTVAQVLRGRFSIEGFEPGKDWYGPYQGADWGFAVSPTVLVRCWIHERTLYIEHEASGYEIDIDDTPALFDRVPNARKYATRADSARPETISYMRRHGYTRMCAVKKHKGLIEDGVEHLRSYERIVIHPRCELAQEQARLWSYKVDEKSGDVLPKLIDKHDDVWDACRYALSPVIRGGKPKPMVPRKPEPPKDYIYKPKHPGNWKTV